MTAAIMRGFFPSLAIVLITLATSAGCRPSGPSEDFGTVVNEIPQVPGAEKPYIVPGIDPPTEAEKQSAKAKSALPKHPPIMDETTADQSNKEQKSDPAPAKTD